MSLMDPPIPATNGPTARATLILRVGLALLFVAAGLSKLYALGPATTVIAEKGIPLPAGVALAAGVAETLAGLLLFAGLRVRLVARLLIPALIFAALVFHNPFGLAPGAAHANAISLTVDILVMLGLGQLARSSAAPERP